MRRIIHFLIVFLLTVIVYPHTAYASTATVTGRNPAARHDTAAESFKSINPKEAKQLIDTQKNLLLLDVRTPQELKNGAIPGSRLVPFWAIIRNQLNLPKDKPIMLICAVGGRSYAAGKTLEKYGYKKIYNLSGGITAWKKAGLPLQYEDKLAR